ncbi:DUF58 domain-containing protein [Oceanirhabdus seepicola]|uniref:DUF58 domain-containing protein n=1 Tax=Oceanirhabdus seepicola TaxID=2828781 RepID=A0A9J6P4U8_9CLOT|nr:DUF58 domain-containing protein [Oceanirhabdus seepicola]MCM1990813.1 DUF58 domain-containing protein [Oceanirhabdus seepicola]
MFIKILFMCLIICILIMLGEITKVKGFEKLKIERNIENNKVHQGESFTLETVVENNKWLPVSFLLIKQMLPNEFEYVENIIIEDAGSKFFHISMYNMMNYERRRRKYNVKVNKRGTYLFHYMEITVGDVFGFSAQTRDVDNFNEVVVYPEIMDLCDFRFKTVNSLGDNIIRRWIFKDPLYIKGIREYNTEDRMKDIHWKSSMKMNKLMVKEYDYTSERELVFIINVQCCDIAYSGILADRIESGIKIAATLAQKALKDSIPTGMWTNARIITRGSKTINKVIPAVNSFEKIMELCARMDYLTEVEFDKFLEINRKNFNRNETYVVITPYLNERCCNIFSKLAKQGINIKLIDISQESNLCKIQGIEKLDFIEEAK